MDKEKNQVKAQEKASLNAKLYRNYKIETMAYTATQNFEHQSIELRFDNICHSLNYVEIGVFVCLNYFFPNFVKGASQLKYIWNLIQSKIIHIIFFLFLFIWVYTLQYKYLQSLKVSGPISQDGNFYSNNTSPPEKSWFQISVKSVEWFGYKKRLCILHLPIPYCVSLIIWLP